MGADNMMAMKFRVKDRNNQLKNFFEAMFDEDIDNKEYDQLPDHPWAKQWLDLYRLGEFISYYSKKDLTDCLSPHPDHDCMFSLAVVEPDVYDISMTYSGKPTSSDLEDLLCFFQPYLTEEQVSNHVAHYSCDWGEYNVAYVFNGGKIYRSGCIGNRDYNRGFIGYVNNPGNDVKWGDPVALWDVIKKPVEEPAWWGNDENKYYDFSKLGDEIRSEFVWEGVQ